MKKIIYLSLILFAKLSLAAELSAQQELILAYQQRESFNSGINPGNTILEIPYQTGIAAYSLNLKYEVNENWKTVLRGRAETQAQSIELYKGLQHKSKNVTGYDLSDAFVEYTNSSNFKSVIGLQVYQWGPAELLSPSNFIVHAESQQKSFLSKDKGYGLLRFNWTEGDGNIVWLSEVQSQNQAPWQAEQEFQVSHLLKYEQNFSGGAHFAGLTLGKHRNQGSALGGYGVWRANDLWSFYFDGIAETKYEYFEPQKNSLGFYEIIQSENENKQLVNLGVRFEDTWDFRVEYIYNSIGWSAEQFSQGVASATQLSPAILKNSVRFSKPGLDLLEKHYVYLSLRIPDLGKKKEIQAFVRCLKPLQSSGVTYQVSFEQAINDAWMAYGEVIQKNGEANQSMTLADQTALSLGFKLIR